MRACALALGWPWPLNLGVWSFVVYVRARARGCLTIPKSGWCFSRLCGRPRAPWLTTLNPKSTAAATERDTLQIFCTSAYFLHYLQIFCNTLRIFCNTCRFSATSADFLQHSADFLQYLQIFCKTLQILCNTCRFSATLCRFSAEPAPTILTVVQDNALQSFSFRGG